jgi:hypothetical protein
VHRPSGKQIDFASFFSRFFLSRIFQEFSFVSRIFICFFQEFSFVCADSEVRVQNED